MTSTVEARTDAPVSEVMRALFPSASVTGAPKVASMRIIESLERFPREIYTGAIGYFTPQRQAQFNVAIRTAVVDRLTGSAFYGVGSGVVADSDAGDEYAECLTKSKILASPVHGSEFCLLETMLWTPDRGVFLLKYHLDRMADSAAYFGFDFDAAATRRALESLVCAFDGQPYRIRLLQPRDGAPKLETWHLRESATAPVALVGLRRHPIDPRVRFLYHKTTNRDVYEQALRSVSAATTLLLWNPDGFLTEDNHRQHRGGHGRRAIHTAGELRTPGRHLPPMMLDQGEIRERKIHMDELPRSAALPSSFGSG